MKRLSWLPVFPLMIGCVNEGVSVATAKSKAVLIAKKLGLPSANPEIELKGKRLIFVKIGNVRYGLDANAGQLQVVRNTPINAASLPTVAKPIRSEEDAWKRSDAVIKALGLYRLPAPRILRTASGLFGSRNERELPLCR